MAKEKNSVVLTFSGDTEKIEKAFDRVGESAGGMRREVGDAAGSFDRAGEAADNVDTKAMGFRDTLTGVQDTMAGTAMLARGPSFEGFLTLGAGIGDLASGFYNALIPAMKSSVTWLKSTRLATVASSAAQTAAAAGSKIWAAANWVLNASLLANPITWIVVAIVALIAVIVLIATKTDWFQRAWKAAWGWIKDAAAAVGHWFRDTLWPWVSGVFERIVGAVAAVPGRMRSAFSTLSEIITWPFRTAFNLVADAWNHTIGRMHWTAPSWLPGIGGKTVSAPRLPHFHAGGTVPGMPGQEVLAVLQAGERVTPAAAAGSERLEISVRPGTNDQLVRALLDLLVFARRTGLA